MLKSKICFTVFVLYEVIAVMLLHFARTCDAMFGGAFCNDGVFKYFLICAGIPMLALVLMIWINEIFFARRRRSFLHRARDVAGDVADGIKQHLGRAFDNRDIDKYLAAAILLGIKKYASRHPQMRSAIHDIINGAGEYSYSYAADDYDDENNDDDYVAPAPKTRRATTTKSTRARRATATPTRARRKSR